MERFLGRHSETIFTALRVVAGLAYACHGAQKLFGLFGGHAMPLFSLMGLAGIIECFGGVLIALGLFASPVAFVASGQMASAYFLSHAPRGSLPIGNGGELAVLYCFLWLYLSARGPGRWSVDALRKVASNK